MAMATDLYETLNVPRNATSQQIRQAYRRLALDTHPDKLPRNASPDEKQAAQDRFTKVNNAYEVLSDESRRKDYDTYGRWPVEDRQNTHPDQSTHRHRHHSSSRHHHPFGNMRSPFDDSFFSPAFAFGAFADGRPSSSRSPFAHNPFSFTDPFELFRHVFEDDPFFNDPFASHAGPGVRHPAPFFNSPFAPPVALFPSMFPAALSASSFQSRSVFSHNPAPSGQWVSESSSSRTINGVTESEWRRVDADGNVHVTKTYPDGRERHLLNGVDQPHPRQSPPHAIDQAPPPPSTSQHALDTVRRSERDRRHRMDAPYDSAINLDERRRRHEERRFHRDRAPVQDDPLFVDVETNTDASHKRHWWQRQSTK